MLCLAMTKISRYSKGIADEVQDRPSLASLLIFDPSLRCVGMRVTTIMGISLLTKTVAFMIVQIWYRKQAHQVGVKNSRSLQDFGSLTLGL